MVASYKMRRIALAVATVCSLQQRSGAQNELEYGPGEAPDLYDIAAAENNFDVAANELEYGPGEAPETPVYDIDAAENNFDAAANELEYEPGEAAQGPVYDNAFDVYENNFDAAACSSIWQQCGGKTWVGPKCCTTGLKCVYRHYYYSQCQRATAPAPVTVVPKPPASTTPLTVVKAPATPAVVVAPSGSAVDIGPYGIKQFYPSVNAYLDWISNWNTARQMAKHLAPDTGDSRCYMNGSGLMVAGSGLLKMSGSNTRYYIQSRGPGSPGWENIEFTAYARLPDGYYASANSGITMVVRSSHDLISLDHCNAHAYYARLWFTDKKIGIQKEFWHEEVHQTTKYSNSIRNVNPISVPLFKDKYFGMKFIVRTRADKKSVNLQLWIDTTEGLNGGTWQNVVDYNDYDWPVIDQSLSCKYSYAPGSSLTSPVLRKGRVSYLRTDAVNALSWKWATLREIAPL